jgi:hypothetical protein
VKTSGEKRMAQVKAITEAITSLRDAENRFGLVRIVPNDCTISGKFLNVLDKQFVKIPDFFFEVGDLWISLQGFSSCKEMVLKFSNR